MCVLARPSPSFWLQLQLYLFWRRNNNNAAAADDDDEGGAQTRRADVGVVVVDVASAPPATSQPIKLATAPLARSLASDRREPLLGPRRRLSGPSCTRAARLLQLLRCVLSALLLLVRRGRLQSAASRADRAASRKFATQTHWLLCARLRASLSNWPPTVWLRQQQHQQRRRRQPALFAAANQLQMQPRARAPAAAAYSRVDLERASRASAGSRQLSGSSEAPRR